MESPLTERIQEARTRRIAQTSPMYQGVMRKALEGSASPRAAIRAMCLHCVGDKRLDVTSCTAYACPLYAYRPYQTEDEGDDE